MTDHRHGRNPIKRVAIVAKGGSERSADLASGLATWLKKRKVSVALDRETAAAIGVSNGFNRDTPPRQTDLLIVAGGDGTLLSMARASAHRSIPILGVNLGSMGFLTELTPEELLHGVRNVLAGDYSIEERCTLDFRLFRGRKKLHRHTVMNDVVIAKSALSRMITQNVEVDGIDVATFTSDGLIISTPTGSTAYSLSAGGPILDPSMSALVITPICPHTMAYRPLVVPGTAEVRVRLLDSTREEVYLTLDGQIGYPLEHRDTVRVKTDRFKVRLVRVAGRSFFEVLRAKLQWGAR